MSKLDLRIINTVEVRLEVTGLKENELAKMVFPIYGGDRKLVEDLGLEVYDYLPGYQVIIGDEALWTAMYQELKVFPETFAFWDVKSKWKIDENCGKCPFVDECKHKQWKQVMLGTKPEWIAKKEKKTESYKTELSLTKWGEVDYVPNPTGMKPSFERHLMEYRLERETRFDSPYYGKNDGGARS
ncbi:MAG: hypothetical protein ABIA75_13925 [Candidatus Neomarinimicrobiota bacterium]